MFIRDQVTWFFSLDESDLFWQMYGATDMLSVFDIDVNRWKYQVPITLLYFMWTKTKRSQYTYIWRSP